MQEPGSETLRGVWGQGRGHRKQGEMQRERGAGVWGQSYPASQGARGASGTCQSPETLQGEKRGEPIPHPPIESHHPPTAPSGVHPTHRFPGLANWPWGSLHSLQKRHISWGGGPGAPQNNPALALPSMSCLLEIDPHPSLSPCTPKLTLVPSSSPDPPDSPSCHLPQGGLAAPPGQSHPEMGQRRMKR